MNPFLWRIVFYLCILFCFGCGSTQQPSESTSPNAVLFDPTTGTVPLPNILATATAKDPLTQYTDPATGNVVNRPANTPMTPPEALAYVNLHEVGGTNAVSGVNAPIYIRFTSPVVPSTVTSANIKVFQIAPDPTGLENGTLRFTDISAGFDYSYLPGSTDLLLFPKFPLLPATRYLYLVTDRVKDAATGGSVSSSVYFEALKSSQPLGGPFAPLEAIRDNVYTDATRSSIQLSGYAKTMNDLIAAPAISTVSSLNQIEVIGRFITTGAGFIKTSAGSTASTVPMESALRAFAAGASLGGLSGKSWSNAVTAATAVPPDAYWSQVAGSPITAPSSVAGVTLGYINSADLSMDPAVVRDHPSAMDLSGVPGADNPAAGVLQPFRSGSALTGFYHVPRSIPFVYIAPALPNGNVVIYQHGITQQKETVIAVAGALTGAGFAVVAIDLPLHGALSPTHQISPGDSASDIAQKQSLWGEDFVAVGAPLATRSNIQQAAFNLDRLEFTLRSGGFVGIGGTSAPPARISFLGMSLGSIVGTYYLAGNTTLAGAGVPYSQATLNADMKGYLSVPGARIAYLLKDSPTFGPSLNSGLADKGIEVGTPTYNQFFLLTQSVIDPADPATMTTPLAAGLPSRLSGRLAMQESTSTSFDAAGIPTNGDLVITNAYTRYLGNALGGRGVLGSDIAPGFDQLGYLGGATPRIPATFMFTRSGDSIVPKTAFARAIDVAGDAPAEGYFQFDQPGIDHGVLIDNTTPLNTALVQTQMTAFMLRGVVVDPTSAGSLARLARAAALRPIPPVWHEIKLPPVLKVLGH